MGSQLSEHGRDKPLSRFRCCMTNDVQKSVAEMMRHRGKRSTDDCRTPQDRETGGRTGMTPEDQQDAVWADSCLGHRCAKKLPYWRDGEEAIAENLANQPAEDGATDDGDAQDDDDDTG